MPESRQKVAKIQAKDYVRDVKGNQAKQHARKLKELGQTLQKVVWNQSKKLARKVARN